MSAVQTAAPRPLELQPQPQHPLAQQPQTMPATTPAQLLALAVNQGADLDRLERLMALQERWEANEARKAFVQAMTAFKGEPLEIFKRKTVAFETQQGDTTSYKHAELSDVVDVVVPALAMHGLSHRWDVSRQDGRVLVTCVVTHRMGHSESVTLDGAPDNSGKKNAIQQTASTITYLQRYTLLAIVGLATKSEPDDDGAGGAAADARPLDWTGVPEPLRKQAEAAAASGLPTYETFWVDTGRQNRKLLAKQHPTLKAQAEAITTAGAP